jgi:hypothetical protein
MAPKRRSQHPEPTAPCPPKMAPPTSRSQNRAKTRNSSPEDHECRHASAARKLGQNMRLRDRYETCMSRSYERAIENLYQLRGRRKN